MKRIIGFILWLLWFVLLFSVTLVYFLVLILLTLILPKTRKTSKFLRKIAVLWGKTSILFSFSRIKIEGKENIFKGNGVIISNHQSPFDIFVALGAYPIDFLFFSKKEIFSIPIIGISMRKLEYISVDRKSPTKSAISTIQSIRKIKEGYRVLIYPEGTRSKNYRKILPFKSGSFLIAQKGELPLIPILIYGSQKVKPLVPSYFIWPGKIIVKILPVIDIKNEWHPANKNSKINPKERISKIQQYFQAEMDAMEKKYGKTNH